MALLTSADVVRPVLAREEVPAPFLGGDVCVRGLLQSEKVSLSRLMAGFSDSLTTDERLSLLVPHMLAMAVVGADDKPLLDAPAWDAYMGRHKQAAIELFNKAYTLADFGGEQAEKNS